MTLGDLYFSCFKVVGPGLNKLEISNLILELKEGILFQFVFTLLNGGTTIVSNFKIISGSYSLRANLYFAVFGDSNFKLLDSVFK